MVFSDVQLVFVLVIVFQIKHYLADFPLQRAYMLQKSSAEWGFFLPLFSHAAVHGAFTLAIVLAVDATYWWLFALDMVVHFIIDRIKSGPKYLGRFNDVGTSIFWNIFGLDQLLHKLTDLLIIYLVVVKPF